MQGYGKKKFQCLILQIFYASNALFCRFQQARMPYFADFGEPECLILQISRLFSRPGFTFTMPERGGTYKHGRRLRAEYLTK
jgi:hypothetical protein